MKRLLLHFYGSASFFEFCFDGFSFLFGYFFFDAFGALSTRSFASFRPRPVISRTTLITLILEAPAFVKDNVEFGLLLA